MNDLISVIVPVYNVSDYIENCVISVLKQTYTDFELILVDDGSTDDSGMLCDKLAAMDSRIVVIHKKNSGVSDARNSGLDIAKGKYICFVDADDTVKENYLEYFIRLIKINDKAKIVVCSIAFLSQKVTIKSKDAVQVCDTEQAFDMIFYETNKYGVYVWNKMFDADLFCNIRFASGCYYEETDIIYRLFAKSSKIVFGNEANYYYNDKREGSTVNTYSYSKYLNKIKFLKEMREYLRNYMPNTMPGFYKFAAFSYVSMLRNLSLNVKNVPEYRTHEKVYKQELRSVVKNVLFNKRVSCKKKVSILFWRIIPITLTSKLYK